MGQGRGWPGIQTSGPFCCRAIVETDVANRQLYFTASGREPGVDPYYEYLYKVNFDGTGLTRLTPENANHNSETMSISPSGRFIVENHSRVDLAPRALVRDASGKEVLELAAPDISRLKAAGWKAPEPIKVKAADNVTDLYGVMWKPFDFDPAKKYPIVLLTYPGPISEVVPKDFNNPLHNFVTGIAQLGCIVVQIGNRGGSAERSKWYNAYGYGNMRDYGLADNKYAVEQVADMCSFVDIDRVGVFGGSGGGFQTANLMLTYPDFFKVGISIAGSTDNNLMENYWAELCNGVKEINENGRTRFECKTPTSWELAGNLKGHLLIMHGLRDSRVNPAVPFRLMQALIEAGKAFDVCILPDEQHQVTRAKYMPYIQKVMWQYFGEYLMGDPRSKTEVFERYKGPSVSSR